MRIKLLRGVVIDGRAGKPGDVVDCPDWQGNYLVRTQKAEMAADAPEVIKPTSAKGRKKKEQ